MDRKNHETSLRALRDLLLGERKRTVADELRARNQKEADMRAANEIMRRMNETMRSLGLTYSDMGEEVQTLMIALTQTAILHHVGTNVVTDHEVGQYFQWMV